MEFETQKQLLEYLGKNGNDRSLVQRMMIRGEIYKENGMYILVDKDKKIEELFSEVQKLRSEITTMKESNWDLEFYKVNSEYWEKECRRYGRLINWVIDVCYGKVKALLGSRFQEDKESFKEWVIEAVKEREKSE